MLYEQVQQSAEYIRSRIACKPETAIILGTGLGGGEERPFQMTAGNGAVGGDLGGFSDILNSSYNTLTAHCYGSGNDGGGAVLGVGFTACLNFFRGSGTEIYITTAVEMDIHKAGHGVIAFAVDYLCTFGRRGGCSVDSDDLIVFYINGTARI